MFRVDKKAYIALRLKILLASLYSSLRTECRCDPDFNGIFTP